MPQAAYWTRSKRSKVWLLYIYLFTHLNGAKTQIGLVGLDWIGGNLKRIASPIPSAQSNPSFCTQPLIGVVWHRLNSKQDGLTV